MRLVLVTLGLFAGVSHADSLRWQKDWSKTQTAIADAEHYCKNLGPGWRLPNRAELASMLVDPNVPESKFAPTAPALPQDGYLWSDEDVSPTRQGQKWIMNLANGHIFNGSGHSGFAKCLKGTPIQEPDVPLGAPVTSIGPANAKVVSIVAMQPDYPWFKVRPMLDQLVASHSVRFELHFYLVAPERYLAPSIALCAAAKAGKFGEVEKQLATTKLDPAALRVDDATAKACQAAIDQDRKAWRKRRLEGVPAFVIGNATIFGAQPIEKFEAAIKAAGG